MEFKKVDPHYERLEQFFHTERRLGDFMIEQGLLTEDQLTEALQLQKKWGSRLGDIILSKGWVRALDHYHCLADHYQHDFINLMKEPADDSLFSTDDLDDYADLLLIPWRSRGETTVVAIAEPSEQAIEFAQDRYGLNIDFVITSKFDIIWHLQSVAADFLSDQSINSLALTQPKLSARQVFSKSQLMFIGVTLSFIMLMITVSPVNGLIAINVALSVYFILSFGMRCVLTWVGGDPRMEAKITDQMVAALVDEDLPTYTVLIPMYKEAGSLPIITSALRKLDYPLSKLDIKLILEEDDEDTIQAAKDLGLEGIFEIIRVPPSLPKTKPKACNYAMHFARGELVTIYDAEDKPEPDQLKKVVCAFQQADPQTVCVQARLNYFNANENWLTRMFTIEYSLWFDYYLPALESLRIPIPLGGTSNHFNMRILRDIGAWDPFNVTEDADLGVRITQRGYRIQVVNSTTFEEANNDLINWIRQRSRWFKGYMQTYLVHMREPVHLYKTLGPVGFWGFQFFIGGTILTAIVLPFFYGMYVFWLITKTGALDVFFPPMLLYISLFNLVAGNGFLIYISMLGAFKRQYFSLVAWSVTAPMYWLLMSIAAYKGFWQLIYNPFYWEKTDHGLSKHIHHDIDDRQDNNN